MRGIQNESSRATALRWSAPYLPEHLVSKVLEIAQGIQDESSRADVLSWFAPHLPEQLLSEVLERVILMEKSSQSDVLHRLVPHLSGQLLSKALEIARGIELSPNRATALSDFAPYLPDSLLSEELEALRRSRMPDDYRADALSSLAPHLPEQLLFEALEVARGMQNESSRASALRALSQYLPEIVSEALEAASGIQDESSRASVFSQFASQLDLSFIDFPLFSKMLHTLSYQERRQFLDALPNLASAVIALSDRSVVKLMVQAIKEVSQQWP